MPENQNELTFTEGEFNVAVSTRVALETAALNATLQERDATISDLRSQVEVAEAAREVAEAAREVAESAIAEREAAETAAREAAAREAKRIEAMKAGAPGLKDSFFTPERAQRWSLMSDDDFSHLITEMAAVSGGPNATQASEGRESAMRGTEVGGASDGAKSAAQTVLGLRRN